MEESILVEPVLEGYLDKEVVMFIDAQNMAGEFCGYDERAYYLSLYGEVVTINRNVVDMIVPAAVWEKINGVGND